MIGKQTDLTIKMAWFFLRFFIWVFKNKNKKSDMAKSICESNLTNRELISISILFSKSSETKNDNFFSFYKFLIYKFQNFKIFDEAEVSSLNYIKKILKKRGYRFLEKMFKLFFEFLFQKLFFRKLKKSHFSFLYFFFNLKIIYKQKNEKNLDFFSKEFRIGGETLLNGRNVKKIFLSILPNSSIVSYFYAFVNLLVKKKYFQPAFIFYDFFILKIKKIHPENICFRNNYYISRYLYFKKKINSKIKINSKNKLILFQKEFKNSGYTKNELLTILSNKISFQNVIIANFIKNLNLKIKYSKSEITFLFGIFFFARFFQIFSGEMSKFNFTQKIMIIIIELKRIDFLKKTKRFTINIGKKEKFYKNKQFLNLHSVIRVIDPFLNRKINKKNFNFYEFIVKKAEIKICGKKLIKGILLKYFFFSKSRKFFLKANYFDFFCSLYFFFHPDLLKILSMAFSMDNCFLSLIDYSRKSFYYFSKKKIIIKNKFGNKIYNKIYIYHPGKKFFVFDKKKKNFELARYFSECFIEILKKWHIISFFEKFTRKNFWGYIYNIFKIIYFKIILKKIKKRKGNCFSRKLTKRSMEKLEFSSEKILKFSNRRENFLFSFVRNRGNYYKYLIIFYRKTKILKKKKSIDNSFLIFFFFLSKFSIRQNHSNLIDIHIESLVLEEDINIKFRNKYLFFNFIHSKKKKKSFQNLKLFSRRSNLLFSEKIKNLYNFLLINIEKIIFINNKNKTSFKNLLRTKKKKKLNKETRFFFKFFFIKSKKTLK